MDSSRASRARERIERLAASRLDATELRLQVLEELRRVIGFEAHCWPLTDPATAAAATTLVDLPAIDLARFLVLHHGANDVNRYTVLAMSRSRAGTLHAATGGDLAKSVHWRESLRQHGVGDELTAVFSDAYGCWGFLEIWRDDRRRPFGPDDTALLEQTAAAATTALRRSQIAACRSAEPTPGRDIDGAAVLVLDDDLRLVSGTSAGTRWLTRLDPTWAPPSPLPGFVYALAGRLIATETGLEHLPPSLRLPTCDNTWVTLRAGRLQGTDPPASCWHIGTITITIETIAASDRLDLLSRTCALTNREREVLTAAAAGLPTRDLAKVLFVTENTVQEHFKSIFTKVGVNSRRELLSLGR